MPLRWLVLALSLTVTITSCGGDIENDDVEGEDGAALTSSTSTVFSIAVLPDTQYYHGTYAWAFKDQTAWIVQHAADSDKNIQLVLGLGDIVDGGGPSATGTCGPDANGKTWIPPSNWQTQWTDAVAAVNTLDGHVPYLFPIGNHDYDCEGQRPQSRAITQWDKYFGPARYTGKSWWHGSFRTGSHANFYNVVTLGGVSYLVLALEFYPTNSDLSWAGTVLSNHAGMPAIIVTHAYLFYDDAGPGTAHRVGSGDSDSATSYKLGPSCPETNITTCGNGNNGTDMWSKLVSQHPNVVLVLNGHFRLPSPGNAYPASPSVPNYNGVGYRTEPSPHGNRVNQISSDYQGQGNNGYFGNGYLRLYTFKPGQGLLSVRTISPSVSAHASLFPSPGVPLDPSTKQPVVTRTDPYNAFDLPFLDPAATTPTIAFTPRDGATVSAGTTIVHASASAPTGVTLIQLFVDGVKKGEAAASSLDVPTTLTAGAHRVTIQARDGNGVLFKVPHSVAAQ